MDTSKMPKTRAAAKAGGAKYYFTGEPCKRGHTAPRKVKGTCIECAREDDRKAADRRRDYFIAYNQRAEVKDTKHSWYMNNRDKVIQAAASRPREVLRQYQIAWKKNNILWVRADTKARRRRHRQATPPWLTRAQKTEIRQLYQIAITATKLTGVQYVVDHIVPLRSEVVCGLHVPWNLQVLTQDENLAKSNKLSSI
jgi:5-methylcytosine-specific restriction endonuclease McrA